MPHCKSGTAIAHGLTGHTWHHMVHTFQSDSFRRFNQAQWVSYNIAFHLRVSPPHLTVAQASCVRFLNVYVFGIVQDIQVAVLLAQSTWASLKFKLAYVDSSMQITVEFDIPISVFYLLHF
jgi:hypothetical protein